MVDIFGTTAIPIFFSNGAFAFLAQRGWPRVLPSVWSHFVGIAPAEVPLRPVAARPRFGGRGRAAGLCC